MTLTTRSGKGSALIHAELDENFNDLDQRFGWVDYNDVETIASPIALVAANTKYELTNDGAGANTRTEFKVATHGPIWNTTTDRFDFSSLKVGDVITIRGDIIFHSTGINHFIQLSIELGTDSGSEILLPVAQGQFKTAGSHRIIGLYKFYIGAAFIQANPGRILAQSDATGDSVTVNGWFIETQVR